MYIHCTYQSVQYATIVESNAKLLQEEVDVGSQLALSSLTQHHQHTAACLQVASQSRELTHTHTHIHTHTAIKLRTACIL